LESLFPAAADAKSLRPGVENEIQLAPCADGNCLFTIANMHSVNFIQVQKIIHFNKARNTFVGRLFPSTAMSPLPDGETNHKEE